MIAAAWHTRNRTVRSSLRLAAQPALVMVLFLGVPGHVSECCKCPALPRAYATCCNPSSSAVGIHSGPTAAEVEASEEGGVTVVRYGGDFLATCKAVGDAAVVSGAGEGGGGGSDDVG